MWDAFYAAVLHEAQLWIVEAMARLDQPLSASSMLEKIIDRREWTVTRLSYHFRRLQALRVVELVEERQVRGAIERLYRLC